MTAFARRPVLRWFVPLVAALVLAGAGATIATTSAGARASLTPRSAAQLLVDVQEAKVEGLSGTVVQSADLGLPDLPNTGGGSSSDFTGLVSGSHTLRVWYAGPTRARLALLGDMSESDLIRNGSDVWLWSSRSNTAKHATIPASAAMPDPAGTRVPGVPVTPQEAADRALEAITPTTSVTTDPTAVVAGRPAYQLVLQPKDTTTLIGTVKIAIDGKTHLPTRVQVFPRGSRDPAFEVGFTSFDPSVPTASVFAFNPPPGATVSEGLPDLLRLRNHPDTSPRRGTGTGTGAGAGVPGTRTGHPLAAGPRVVGAGYASVVVARLPQRPASGSGGPGGLEGVLTKLPRVSGAWGSGHLLRGTLFSVLLTDDGRVVAGAVAPNALYAALSAS
jgi:outer membrane lipoprotein-sorting protein